MRARPPLADTRIIAAQIEATAGIGRLRELDPGFAQAGPDTIQAILDEAARFADTLLTPLNERSDATGCALVDGRVRTPPGHRESWTGLVEAGWAAIDHPADLGGQGLPLAVTIAVQELFDRSNPAFGMALVPQRSAARLIAAHGDDVLKATWLPRLVSGEWAATICISEVDAGSDVHRLRTRAVRDGSGPDSVGPNGAGPNGAGTWRITGEKCWISFGDHDLSPRIGHCLLARTDGSDGLSLFLVPDTLDEGNRNAIAVRRIDHKMGLHGSPTCALGFEGATGHLIGIEGRGLQQMFVMITNMRLSVGVQGLGIASAASDVAWAYAAERKQGGPHDAPVTIDRHADVQRMLLDMAARVDVLRGLILATAVAADLARHETDPAAAAQAAALAQWLLPIVKTTGGEYGFDTASEAIQILGGAGYTGDWPVEQALRDARVLTIYEGTTGIQSIDLVQRRLRRGDAAGYHAFLRSAREAAAHCTDAQAGTALDTALDLFEMASRTLMAADAADADAGATSYLHLAALVATGWIAARNTTLSHGAGRLAQTGGHWLTTITPRARMLANEALAGAGRLTRFESIRSTPTL